MKVIVVIPARLNSSRLPNKVILDICGKPMVQHVYEAAKKSKNITDVYIATDSEEVKVKCQAFTSNIIMTSKEHESGTDRLAEAIKSIECDYVINVQGDEPLIDPDLISQIAISRSIIPHYRDNWEALLNHHTIIPEPFKFFKHIGIYGYKKEFLLYYATMEQTYLEKLEKLEQLRVLENGYKIKMIETEYEPVGVDVQEDLEKVREMIKCQ